MRLDAADGSFDGFSNTQAIETSSQARRHTPSHAATRCHTLPLTLHATRDQAATSESRSRITFSDIRRATRDARRKFRAEVGNGYYLPAL